MKSHEVLEKADPLKHDILGKRRRDDNETGLQDLTEEFNKNEFSWHS